MWAIEKPRFVAAPLWACLLSLGIFVTACSIRAEAPAQTGEGDGIAGGVLPLAVEELGAMVFRGNAALGSMVPDPTGNSFCQLVYAFPTNDTGTIVAPFEIHAVNLQTGAVSRARASTGTASVGRKVFSSAWGADGKLYLGTEAPPHLISWDPKTQTARDHGRVWNGVKNAVSVYSLTRGTDGAIYGGGANVAVGFRFDPATNRLQEYGVLGLPRTYHPAYAYTIAADDRFVYVASGKIPWYIVAYDRQTGMQQNLLTFDASDYPSVHQSADGVYARVLVRSDDGTIEGRKFYSLQNGVATEVSSQPQGTPHATPMPSTRRPEVFLDTSTASESQTVRLWYRLAADRTAASQAADTTPEQLGWRSVSVPVATTPVPITHLALLPNGRLVGASLLYGEMFSFDTATGRREVLGVPTHISIYSMLVGDGRLYFGGYPSAPLCRYDPAKLWTYGKGMPLARWPPAESEGSNPRQLVSLGARFGIHYATYLARDAQGRLYVGGHAERSRVGGALAVYDPATGSVSGVGAPTLTHYDCAGLAATSDGRFVVYSSNVVKDPLNPTATPASAKLFVYDTAAGRIVREWTPLPGNPSTGLLATGAAGQVVGLAKVGGGLVLYALEVSTGRKVWQRSLTGGLPQAGFLRYVFRRGPDGKVWTYLGKTLVRVTPETGEVTAVGTVSGSIGELAFVGQDLYLAGDASLRRVRRAVIPDF